MSALSHHTVEANGIRLHYAAAGEGPLVVLCHGWPESWSSWRHRIAALAAAGYRAVAPDMRGYGRGSRPDAVGACASRTWPDGSATPWPTTRWPGSGRSAGTPPAASWANRKNNGAICVDGGVAV